MGIADPLHRQGLSYAVRYYFTIRDGRTDLDHTGYVLEGPEEATSYARTIAAELRKEAGLLDSSIIVTDERGNLVVEIDIATAEPAPELNERPIKY